MKMIRIRKQISIFNLNISLSEYLTGKNGYRRSQHNGYSQSFSACLCRGGHIKKSHPSGYRIAEENEILDP